MMKMNLSKLGLNKIFTKKNMKSLMVLSVLVFLMMITVYFYYSSMEGFESLKPKDLEKSLENGQPKLVLFYANWCPHCTDFKPTWDEVCTSVNEGGENKMLAVDLGDKSDESRQLMEEYEVDGFPTIVLIKNNGNNKSLEKYEGPRDTISLLNYTKLNL